MNSVKTLLIYSALLVSSASHADITRDKDLEIKQIASGLDIVWGIEVLPDNTLLVSQRGAQLTHVSDGTNTHISGLPDDILVDGQGGFFDVALPPDYAKTGWAYFSYNKAVGEKGATTLARAKLNGDSLIDWQDLLVTNAKSGKSVHYGGRISFDGKGHVFLSVGERGERANGQDLSTHAGSILRLNMDGSVPADNPFVNKDNALPEIWSYGHRNPQGLFYNQQTEQLWEQEHGPRGGDEINLIEAGNNYGWADISFGKEYWAPLPVGSGTEKEGMEQPVKMYDPSIAPSGLMQYQGELFPQWQGKLINGAMKLQHLNIVTLNDNNEAVDEQRLLRTLSRRIRDVIEAPDGALLVGTDSGEVYRISPKS